MRVIIPFIMLATNTSSIIVGVVLLRTERPNMPTTNPIISFGKVKSPRGEFDSES